MAFIKRTLKYAALVGLSVILEVALVAPLIMGLTASPLGKLGHSGAIILLFLLSVLAPVISALLIIGILGGMWIADKKYTGFTLAFFFSLIQLIILMGGHEVSFDYRTLMILAGIPAIILSGGYTYLKIQKWKTSRVNLFSRN
jgi:hypothetical protein